MKWKFDHSQLFLNDTEAWGSRQSLSGLGADMSIRQNKANGTSADYIDVLIQNKKQNLILSGQIWFINYIP